jgi:hypothetical protein
LNAEPHHANGNFRCYVYVPRTETHMTLTSTSVLIINLCPPSRFNCHMLYLAIYKFYKRGRAGRSTPPASPTTSHSPSAYLPLNRPHNSFPLPLYSKSRHTPLSIARARLLGPDLVPPRNISRVALHKKHYETLAQPHLTKKNACSTASVNALRVPAIRQPSRTGDLVRRPFPACHHCAK